MYKYKYKFRNPADSNLLTGSPGNFRICDCELIIRNLRVSDLRTGTPQKLADLRLRKEPKNLRILRFAD
jgi:hypothetical protein